MTRRPRPDMKTPAIVVSRSTGRCRLLSLPWIPNASRVVTSNPVGRTAHARRLRVPLAAQPTPPPFYLRAPHGNVDWRLSIHPLLGPSQGEWHDR
jgi:hypothetical protein